MEHVRLGGTGLRVSRLCLGMMSYYSGAAGRPWMLDETAAEPIVRRAVEGGITFFDTADMYSEGASEIVTGRLLRKLFARDEIVIAIARRHDHRRLEHRGEQREAHGRSSMPIAIHGANHGVVIVDMRRW